LEFTKHGQADFPSGPPIVDLDLSFSKWWLAACRCRGASRPRGLCLRVYENGAKSFIFVYCIGDRQRFIRIGKSPERSVEAARVGAKELRSIVDQGRDPARENRGREIPPIVGRNERWADARQPSTLTRDEARRTHA
jgi:hypothetical protein